MLELGLGYLDLTPEQFWDYTPRLFQLKLKGKKDADYELQKAEWERMRFQTTALINKDRKRKDQIKLTDLIKFDWEKNKKRKNIDADRKKAQYLLMKATREHKKKNG